MKNSLEDQFASLRQTDKYGPVDKQYLSDRTKFAESLGRPDLFEFIDQFALYAGDQTLAARIVASDLVRATRDVPGHVVEFGVWHGSNLLLMAKVLRLISPNTTKLVIGFDNFAGLPEPVSKDGAAPRETVGRYKGNEEVLRAAIELYDLSRAVHLVKGDATTTIKAFESAFPEAMFSLAWLDFDLYEPCRVALDLLKRRLSVGGVIVLDEAISSLWPGETTALLEFLSDSGQRFSMHANTLGRQPVMWLSRLP